MPNPKCRQCSKILPDGFTDCPWCGAKHQHTPPQTSLPAAVGVQKESPTQAPGSPLLWIGFLCSFALFCFLQYKQMLPIAGEISFADSAYLLGRCLGSFLLAAIFVFLFDKIRRRNPSTPTRLLAISTVACVMSVLALASESYQRHIVGSIRQATRKPEQPHLDKWGVAVRPFFMELVSRNRQYLDEVSKLDAALQPLYSPASFGDAASVHSMLDALRQRLAVADEYADVQPVVAKMPGYVATVDASDKEKQEFLAGFNESLAKGLSGKNSVSALEHNWIASAIDLYNFALAHAYSYNFGHVLFKSSADAVAFNYKLNKSRDLYAQFLRAYQTSRRAQDTLLAQIGFQRSDVPLDHPQ